MDGLPGTHPDAPPPAYAPSVAIVGGGTGLAAVLRALKPHLGSGALGDLSAIVTVCDDGGSSGRLRRDLGVLPPGDIRNCLVALANDEDLIARLFAYRFGAGGGLSGHSFGNLFLVALAEIAGDFTSGIRLAESVLQVRGRILPATADDVRLLARGRSGRVYEGESAIGRSGEPLTVLAVEPEAPAALPQAVEAIESADLVLLGPGSLYTSVLPNILIPRINEALRRTRGRVALVMNLMTQPGETDGMTPLDHLEAVRRYAGTDTIDLVIANGRAPSPYAAQRYAREGSTPLVPSREDWPERAAALVLADLLADGPLIRHDPARLGAAILSLATPQRRGAYGRSEVHARAPRDRVTA